MCLLHICGFNVFRISVNCNEKRTKQLLSNSDKRRARFRADVADKSKNFGKVGKSYKSMQHCSEQEGLQVKGQKLQDTADLEAA